MQAYFTLMSMWQNDLAKYINELFNKKFLSFTERYNLNLAGQVWKDRFGNYPTIGEINIFIK
jgi:hypothetical protein